MVDHVPGRLPAEEIAVRFLLTALAAAVLVVGLSHPSVATVPGSPVPSAHWPARFIPAGQWAMNGVEMPPSWA